MQLRAALSASRTPSRRALTATPCAARAGVKRVVVIVATVFVFRNPMTPQTALGTAVALAGVFAYSQARARVLALGHPGARTRTSSGPAFLEHVPSRPHPIYISLYSKQLMSNNVRWLKTNILCSCKSGYFGPPWVILACRSGGWGPIRRHTLRARFGARPGLMAHQMVAGRGRGAGGLPPTGVAV